MQQLIRGTAKVCPCSQGLLGECYEDFTVLLGGAGTPCWVPMGLGTNLHYSSCCNHTHWRLSAPLGLKTRPESLYFCIKTLIYFGSILINREMDII